MSSADHCKTTNRTLEDLDDYFDRDSGNPTFIKISNKMAKSKDRPVEAVEAERMRVAAAAEWDSKMKIDDTAHVEEVAYGSK